MNKLILTVGLPRSGKSTWAKAQGHPIVNPDSIRLAVHGQAFVPQAEPLVWAIARYMVASLFGAGHTTVIVDATNTTKKRRAEWESKTWEVQCQVFDTSKDECIERAKASNHEYLIPIIERMAAAWENP